MLPRDNEPASLEPGTPGPAHAGNADTNGSNVVYAAESESTVASPDQSGRDLEIDAFTIPRPG
jgi:hypothetical protein